MGVVKPLHHAIQSTMAGKGVSVLVIPGDVSTQEAGDDTFTGSTRAGATARRLQSKPNCGNSTPVEK